MDTSHIFSIKKKTREFQVLEQKRNRYKSCLLYMDAFFEPQNIKYLSSRHADINEASDVIEYLKMEFFEMTLYASKEVILAVRTFIEKPVRENFLKTILAMRRDLSAKRIDLSLQDIELDVATR